MQNRFLQVVSIVAGVIAWDAYVCPFLQGVATRAAIDYKTRAIANSGPKDKCSGNCGCGGSCKKSLESAQSVGCLK